MTEDEWQASDDPERMVSWLDAEAHQRELRLFVAACARRVWHLLPEPSRAAVEAAEQFAEGTIDGERLASAFAAADSAARGSFPGHSAPDALAYAASAAADASSAWPRTASNVLAASSCAASAAGCAAGEAEADESRYDAAFESTRRAELVAQASLLRDLIPAPTRPRPPDPGPWRGG